MELTIKNSVILWLGISAALLAVLAHMGVDVMAALTQRGVVGVLASTLWLAVWAAGLAAWAVRLYRVQREQ